MADQALADPGHRGETIIEDQVLERIAGHAACEVAGVVATGSDLEGLIGRQLPKASAQVAGTRARVALTVAVAWPHPLADVAAHVRDHVRTSLVDMTGLRVDAVDVDIAQVVQPERPRRRRVQ